MKPSKKTINDVLIQRIEKVRAYPDEELLAKISKMETLMEPAMEAKTVKPEKALTFLLKIHEREGKTPGAFFPFLYLTYMGSEIQKRGGNLIVIGGWNTFIYLYSAFGNTAIDRWKGSHDLDFATSSVSTSSLIATLNQGDMKTEIYTSLAHGSKKSGIIKYEPFGKSCQVDLYIPCEEGGAMGIKIEDKFTSMQELRPIEVDLLKIYLTHPIPFIDLKLAAERKHDIVDSIDTLCAVSALRNMGVDIEDVGDITRQLNKNSQRVLQSSMDDVLKSAKMQTPKKDRMMTFFNMENVGEVTDQVFGNIS